MAAAMIYLHEVHDVAGGLAFGRCLLRGDKRREEERDRDER